MPVAWKNGAVAAAASITLPSHAVGDVLIIFAYRRDTSLGGLTSPSVPSASGTVPAWSTLAVNSSGNNSNAYNSLRVAYYVATATNHTSGTWTNASVLQAVVVSGSGSDVIGGYAIGDIMTGSGTVRNITAPEVALTKSDGSSLLIHSYFSYNGGTWSTAPSGYTNKLTSTYNIFTNVKDVTTTDGAIDQTVTLATQFSSNVAQSFTLEILAPPNPAQFFSMF